MMIEYTIKTIEAQTKIELKETLLMRLKITSGPNADPMSIQLVNALNVY